MKNRIVLGRNEKLIEVLGFVSLSLILLSIPFYFKLIFGFNINFQYWGFYLPYAILWGGVLVAAKYGFGYIRYVLEINIFRYVGVISYSVYLFHMPILDILTNEKTTIAQEWKIYIFFIATLLVSSLTYLLIEFPLSKVKLYKVRLSEKMITELKNNG